MATNIVPSLFGLTQQQVRQQQLMQDRAYAQEVGATLPPAYRSEAMLGATIGSGVARGVAGLFGLKTAEEQRAFQMDEALKSAVSSLPPEMRNNRSAVMGKVSEMLSGNPDFQREALEAQFQANEFALEDTATRAKTASYVASEESSRASANLNKVRASQEVLDNQQKQLELQGQFASGALESYKKNTDPQARARVWNNSLKSFKGLGIDTAAIEELPESERQGYLEQVVESSKNTMSRIREQANINTADYRNQKLTLDKTKFQRSQAFKEKQASISNSIRQTTANLASEKFTFEKKKVLFSQANDLLKANERNLDDIRADLQDDIDERTKLETGKQFGLSEEDTNVRKAELDARIKQGRATVKQGELLLKESRKQLEGTKFDSAPGLAPESSATTPSKGRSYMSDEAAKSQLGTRYKPGYKYFIEGGRVKGEAI
jgi:hypothetical protein